MQLIPVVAEQLVLDMHDVTQGRELLASGVDQAQGNRLVVRKAAFSNHLIPSAPDRIALAPGSGELRFRVVIYSSLWRDDLHAPGITRAFGLPLVAGKAVPVAADIYHNDQSHQSLSVPYPYVASLIQAKWEAG